MSLPFLTLAKNIPRFPLVIGRLIERNDTEKLKTVNVLFDRVSGLPKLVAAFKSYVTVGYSHLFLPTVFTRLLNHSSEFVIL